MADDANKPAAPERERQFGRMVGPADGYTLRGVCVPTDSKKAKVAFTFRPALPEAVYDHRIRMGEATDGAGRLKAVRDLLAAHLVDWDVQELKPNGTPGPLPFSPAALDRPEVRRFLGVEYLDQMSNFVTGYLAGEWEADAKN